MNSFLKEILSQDDTLSNTFNYIINKDNAKYQIIKDSINLSDYRNIIFTGMGSSLYSSYPAFCLLNQNGIMSSHIEAGEFLHHLLPRTKENYLKKSLVVMVSQSGESAEIIDLLKKFKNFETPPLLIGVTNNAESSLAYNSDYSLLMRAGNEESVTSKTYTSSLLLLYIFAQNIVSDIFNESREIEEIKNLISHVQKILHDERTKDLINSLLNFYRKNISFFIFLARGSSLATAYQAALNHQEIVKGISQGYSCSTFRHGGIESLDSNSNLMFFTSDINSFKLNEHLIRNMIMDWECNKILHIHNTNDGSRDNLLNRTDKLKTIQHTISNPFLAPIVEIIYVQFFMYNLAKIKGISPGKFKFTHKITRDL